MEKTPNPFYDFIFIGMGASSSLMLMSLSKRRLLEGKRVLVIDPDEKKKNDRTFCFWAKEEEDILGDLGFLIHRHWNKVGFEDGQSKYLDPYAYCCIQGLDLYQEAKRVMVRMGMERISSPVEDVSYDSNGTYVVLENYRHYGHCIFDSRPPKYFEPKFPQIHLSQSFLGWFVRLDRPCPDEKTVTLMDFSVPQMGSTQFMYVLPFDKQHALVELTRFGKERLKEEEAFPVLENYIETRWGSFEIEDTEIGNIPMSNCEIEKINIPRVIALGARAGMIKSSTGYAFKNMYNHAEKWATELQKTVISQSNVSVKEGVGIINRFDFYDNLLLLILSLWPSKGKGVFVQLFSRISIHRVIRFLEEETGLRQEASIFKRLPIGTFVRALIYYLSPYWRHFFIFLFLLTWLLFSRNQEWQNVFGIAVLSVGMLAVGIPHGALDHLLESKVSWNKGLVVFVMKYVLTMLIMAVLWWVWPVLALLVFLLASVWHFGQADGQSWGLTPAVFTIWGASVLAFVLGTHAEETHLILKGMGISLRPMERGAFLLIPWLIYAILKRNAQWILTILWLSLTAKVSLILAFGIFFIGHHSLTGWSHLKQDFKMSNWKMWTMSLPFQMGAWLFLLGFYFFWPEQNHEILWSKWGIFFIFISCVSFPHILAMHRFYRR